MHSAKPWQQGLPPPSRRGARRGKRKDSAPAEIDVVATFRENLMEKFRRYGSCPRTAFVYSPFDRRLMRRRAPVFGRAVATGGAAAAAGCGLIGQRHRGTVMLAPAAEQMVLTAGMGLVTGKAGDRLLADMQNVQIAGAGAERRCPAGCLLANYGPVMAGEAELLQRHPQQPGLRRGMGCMAAKTVPVAERRVDTLLPGLIVVTFVAEPGSTVLDLAETVIELMVAVGELVARIAAIPLQGTVETGAAGHAPVTENARFAAEGINRPCRGGTVASGGQGAADGGDERNKQEFHNRAWCNGENALPEEYSTLSG